MMEKKLNSYTLAQKTGLQTMAITRNAKYIPGAKKVNGCWEFPLSAVEWVEKRVRRKLYINE